MSQGSSRSRDEAGWPNLAGPTYENGDGSGISLFTRDDATGAREKSKTFARPTLKRADENSVRAMLVHRDKVTGIDRLFVSAGVLGVFSGVHDPAAPGKTRWDAKPETALFRFVRSPSSRPTRRLPQDRWPRPHYQPH